jgi:lauroyl/myristoyl acyltransferase
VIELATRIISWALVRRMKATRQVVRANLSRAMGGASRGTLDEATRRAFYYYVYYWMEALKLPGVSPLELPRRMEVEGIGHLHDGLDAGRGVILALPHLGSWDYAGAWMAAIGYPMTVVVEPLEPAELFDWFAELRSRLGMQVVPLGPKAAPAVLGSLERNLVVGLLADRDLMRNGIEVEFMGERTTLPAGPAALAMRSGAALLPTAVYTLPRGNHLSVVLPPVSLERTGRFRDDAARITQDLADQLAVLIRRAPEQWHMFQPNWPADS